MSIFSRLFKGQEDGDKEAAQSEGAAADARPEHARKPTPEAARAAQAAHEAKGSMRPEAPSFQINPPSERGQAANLPGTIWTTSMFNLSRTRCWPRKTST